MPPCLYERPPCLVAKYLVSHLSFGKAFLVCTKDPALVLLKRLSCLLTKCLLVFCERPPCLCGMPPCLHVGSRESLCPVDASVSIACFFIVPRSDHLENGGGVFFRCFSSVAPCVEYSVEKSRYRNIWAVPEGAPDCPMTVFLAGRLCVLSLLACVPVCGLDY